MSRLKALFPSFSPTPVSSTSVGASERAGEGALERVNSRALGLLEDAPRGG